MNGREDMIGPRIGVIASFSRTVRRNYVGASPCGSSGRAAMLCRPGAGWPSGISVSRRAVLVAARTAGAFALRRVSTRRAPAYRAVASLEAPTADARVSDARRLRPLSGAVMRVGRALRGSAPLRGIASPASVVVRWVRRTSVRRPAASPRSRTAVRVAPRAVGSIAVTRWWALPVSSAARPTGRVRPQWLSIGSPWGVDRHATFGWCEFLRCEPWLAWVRGAECERFGKASGNCRLLGVRTNREEAE